MDIRKVTTGLNELIDTVDKANLTTGPQCLVNGFSPILKELFQLFNQDKNKPIQQLHFAAIYGLVKIHCAQIKLHLEWTKSAVGYARSFIETNASQTYHQALLNFLSKYENEFENYCGSHDAKEYIGYSGDLGQFSYGKNMNDENNEGTAAKPSTSLFQLEKRIFALVYCEMYQAKVNKTLSRHNATAVVTNAAAFAFALPALPVTLAATLYVNGYLDSEKREIQSTLKEHFILSNINDWRREIQGIISKPSLSQAALDKFNTPLNHLKSLKLF